MSKRSSTSEYTRQQAELFLSQVKYEIKLEELDVEVKGGKANSWTMNEDDYEGKLLKMIEDEMQNTQIAREQQLCHGQK